MAPKTPPEPKTEPKVDPDDPDAGAKKALEAERKLRRDAEQKAKDAEAELEKLKGEGKSENEKLTEQLETFKKDLDQERVMRIKAEVAAEKGLTPAQAKRLTGTTKEELDADADELMEAFPTPAKDDGDTTSKKPPSPRPKPDLTGGTDPTGEPTETDPAKLAESVPRL